MVLWVCEWVDEWLCGCVSGCMGGCVGVRVAVWLRQGMCEWYYGSGNGRGSGFMDGR